MSKDYTKELEKMQHLMNYGINESKNTVSSNGIVEYSQVGADGQTYGILKEGTKYFVKVAPKKDTEVLAEDYDYIGGYLNRKSYDSYTKASNALNLELIHINESCGSKEPVKSQFNINESAEWENKDNQEMKAELNRFYQLVENVDNILSENVHYIKEKEEKGPFTENPSKHNANGGGNDDNGGNQPKDLGIKNKSYVGGGEEVNPDKVYNKNGVKGTSPSGEYNAANGINPDTKEPYTEKAKPSSVSENKQKHVVKLTEDQKKQVLAWRDDRAFVHPSSDSELDRSHGTEIGDTAPYKEQGENVNDNVNENFETTEWDDGLPGSAGIGEPKKYKEPFEKQEGVTQPVSENNIYEFVIDDGMGNGDDNFDNDFLPLVDSNYDDKDNLDLSGFNDINMPDGDPIEGSDDEVDAQIYQNLENDDPLADLPDNDSFDNDDKLNPLYETIKRIVETKLDDFGKHPAYQKKVMTLPKNADGSEWGEDWNDESTKGDEPYGKQIGSSAPYDDVVSAITNAVVTALGKKKE